MELLTKHKNEMKNNPHGDLRVGTDGIVGMGES